MHTRNTCVHVYWHDVSVSVAQKIKLYISRRPLAYVA